MAAGLHRPQSPQAPPRRHHLIQQDRSQRYATTRPQQQQVRATASTLLQTSSFGARVGVAARARPRPPTHDPPTRRHNLRRRVDSNPINPTRILRTPRPNRTHPTTPRHTPTLLARPQLEPTSRNDVKRGLRPRRACAPPCSSRSGLLHLPPECPRAACPTAPARRSLARR
jgi:hypothetical protein